MKPSARYQEFMQLSGFRNDSIQQHVVYLLDRLYDEILSTPRVENGLLSRVMSRFGRCQPMVRGLYIWGGVGRGKTLLMDIFFESLPIAHKKRIHFHAFMKMIHERLTEIGKVKEPLSLIAKDFARDVRVLCLDEFVVTDIGDAMLIAQLLDALLAQGVILVTTSNSAPEDLYRDGLQRSRFLPAIDLLATHCVITNLDGGQDYRVLGIKDDELYRFPHSDDINTSIREHLLSHHVMPKEQGFLQVNKREIGYVLCAEDSIWFDFESLCVSARSRLDYLEIARQFHTLVLTGIQQMDNRSNDVAKRFIALIDVLYDHRVKLICSAEVAPIDLYSSGFLAGEFERTVSRLTEMQSHDYRHQSHRID